MTKKNTSRNKNALHHGLYSSDFILPWEKAEDFDELLNGVREDFTPQEQSKTGSLLILPNPILEESAGKPSRLNFSFCNLGLQIVASGKRTVKGISAHVARPIDENDGFDVHMKRAELLRSMIPDLKITEEVKNRFFAIYSNDSKKSS